MFDKPRLSFVVPVYNPKREVFEKCVKALAAQALAEWEAIFVLDGKFPEARNIIIKNKDERFQIVEIEHAGAQAARNKGGELAQGEFLCFLDSDCVLEPGASKMWVERFDKHPDIAFIYSGYKFFGNQYAIESEPFDPWTLRVRNYISGCFPMRKAFYPGWAPELKSLQDWDMWLSLLEKAEKAGKDVSKLGLYVPGYAFTTALPEAGSISGDGCKPDVWLDRMDAVKKRHGLPDREICVSSISHAHDGIALAKLINADFVAMPADKPHRYKTMIQVGFSMGPDSERHAAIFQAAGMKKILFWTSDNINEIYNGTKFQTIDAFSGLLNKTAVQYVEDLEAKRLMTRAGFKVEIMPLPIGKVNILPKPKEKKWAVDIAGDYSPMLVVVEKSLPDIPLEMLQGSARLSDYVGVIHFFKDRTLTTTIKRAHLTGRHVISNVQSPYCGFIDDKWDMEKFIVEGVEKIRELTNKEPDPDAGKMYEGSKFLEAVCA
jgi:glycosyltransferase involved in cell wall biosynthesis